MTTLKHSPGPWSKFYSEFNPPFMKGVIVSLSKRHLAWLMAPGAGLTESEAAANARLIAAAPEMLAALTEITDAIKSVPGEEPNDDPRLIAALKKSYDIIAMATGN